MCKKNCSHRAKWADSIAVCALSHGSGASKEAVVEFLIGHSLLKGLNFDGDCEAGVG